jgi:hypothetical protein
MSRGRRFERSFVQRTVDPGSVPGVDGETGVSGCCVTVFGLDEFKIGGGDAGTGAGGPEGAGLVLCA